MSNYDVEMRLNIKTPMRDGINLSSDIYLPKSAGKISDGVDAHTL